MSEIPDISAGIRKLLDTYEESQKFPYGPPVTPQTSSVAADACQRLCGGDQDRARTLWKKTVARCGGYMPEAAAIGLAYAFDVSNLIPDVAPDPRSDLG